MIARTKIICTIGPATNTPEMLEKLLDAGMNVARLNFSHGTHESHSRTIAILKELRQKRQVPLAIMLDTKGPEIRLGQVESPIKVSPKDRLTLTNKEILGSKEAGVTLYPSCVFPYIKEQASVLIDDGYIQAVVVHAQENSVEIEFQNSGEIKSNKSLSIKDIDVALPFMTEKDIADLKFGGQEWTSSKRSNSEFF